MIAESKVLENINYLRLVSVDKLLVIPSRTVLRFLITSDDVLHSWAVPALGVKVDACPGRLNTVISVVTREGLFNGACSELCGVNHAFMPINVMSVPALRFFEWRMLPNE